MTGNYLFRWPVLLVIWLTLHSTGGWVRNYLQDDKTRNFLNGGVIFSQVDTVQPNTHLASSSYGVRLPKTLQDLGWNLEEPCVVRNVTFNCTELDFVRTMKASLEGSMELLRDSLSLFPRLKEKIFVRNIRLSPSTFYPAYPKNPHYGYLLNRSQDAIWDSASYVHNMNSFVYFRRQINMFKRMHDARTSWAVTTSDLGRMANKVRLDASDLIQEQMMLVDEVSHLLAGHVMNASLALEFIGEWARSVDNLLEGVLTPFLVPLKKIQRALAEFNDPPRWRRKTVFKTLIEPASVSYSDITTSCERDDDKLYIHFSFRVTTAPTKYDVYKVHVVPLYVDLYQGIASMRLMNAAAYLAVATDMSSFIEMTPDQLDSCRKEEGRYCSQVLGVNWRNDTESCTWAFFTGNKAGVLAKCHYRATPSQLPKGAWEYAKGYIFVTNISTIDYVMGNQTELTLRCPHSQCVVEVYCNYTIRADYFVFPARTFNCRKGPAQDLTHRFLNLAVGIHVMPELKTVFSNYEFNTFIENQVFEVEDATLEKLRDSKVIHVQYPKSVRLQVNYTYQPLVEEEVDPWVQNLDSTVQILVAVFCALVCVFGSAQLVRHHLFMNNVNRKLNSLEFGVMVEDALDVRMKDLLAALSERESRI